MPNLLRALTLLLVLLGGCEKPAQRTAKAAPDWRAADLEPQKEELVQSGASHARLESGYNK